MVEPFYNTTGEGTIHTVMWAQRFKDLRDYALELPKFGTDTADEEVYRYIILKIHNASNINSIYKE